MILIAKVRGPWGPAGSEMVVKKPSATQKHYLDNGVLVERFVEPEMTDKERAIARAEALGLDTSGTQKDIEKRIAEFDAAAVSDDPSDDPVPNG